MYRYSDGESREIRSGVLDSYVRKVKDAAERNEWKYNGTGAAFTGTYQQRPTAENAVSSIYSRVNSLAEYNGELIYSIDIDSTNGIYRKGEGDSEGIVLCSSSTAYRDLDIRGELMLTSAHFAGESNIAIMNIATKKFNTYTEGHTLDFSPVWSADGSPRVYFCSSGLPEGEERTPEQMHTPPSFSQIVTDMYSAASRATRGPTAICRLDVMEGRLREILADDAYDFTHPASTSDGSLYYIRKPYRQNNGGSGLLGCLTDIFMLPVRLFGALFGFLNVFSAKYSGKTLSRGDVKNRDSEKMFIDGNLINAEKELENNRKRGDENPGIIPRSWELHRLAPDGSDTLIRGGVTAYRVDEQSGDILISNGSGILRISPDGKEEKIISAEKVVYIK